MNLDRKGKTVFNFSNPRSPRKFRNPLYTSDFRLERKLSPSTYAVSPPITTTTYVSPTSTATLDTTSPSYVQPPVYPPQTPPPATGDGTPPIYDPTNPGGPTTPTYSY
jgi:hypothetical protein